MMDTAVLAAAERGECELSTVTQPNDQLAIAAVTAAELLLGVELAGDSRRAERRRSWIDRLVTEIGVVDYTLEVARSHARLMAETRRSGKPRGSHDLIIAATALATGRTVMTFDKGFAEMPGVEVRVLDKAARRPGAT